MRLLVAVATLLDHPITTGFLSFVLSLQLLSMSFDCCRPWRAYLMPGGLLKRTLVTNETLARDFERILDSLKTNETTFESIEADKRLVFVGVMTTRKYLATRALMIQSTWGKRVPGKLHFFSSADSTTSRADLPLVALPGVDDSYPPQKKSFMMLKYMHDNYIDEFEWFMRVDDDVHIKTDRLEHFLRSLNSTQPHFIGQPGQGNTKELGHLGLASDENYCIGGTGMIFSRAALRAIAANISFCTNNMMTTHEDVEVGRCLRKLANISCTWSYESDRLWRLDWTAVDGVTSSFNGDLLTLDVLQSITLHPIKKPADFYRLDNFLLQRRIMQLRERHLQLKLDSLLHLSHSESANASSSVVTRRRLGQPHEFSFMINKGVYEATSNEPRRRFEGHWLRALTEAKRQLNEQLFVLQVDRHSERRRIQQVHNFDYGYVRHHPLVGLEFIIEMSIPFARRFVLRQQFNALLFRVARTPTSNGGFHTLALANKYRRRHRDGLSINTILDTIFRQDSGENDDDQDDNTETRNKDGSGLATWHIAPAVASKWINLIVPLSKRWDTFRRFMANWERVVLADRHERHVRLVVVLFESSDEVPTLVDADYQNEDNFETTNNNTNTDTRPKRQSELTQMLFNRLRSKYGESRIAPDTLRLIVLNETRFSRSIGCEEGANLFAPSDLLFFIDVDMVFSGEFLTRVRLNTVLNQHVYYPIVFSQYDDSESVLDAVGAAAGAKRNNNNNNVSTMIARALEDEFKVSDARGFWRQYGYGMLGVYLSDLRRVGGFNVSLVGWGYEDVDLFGKFISHNVSIVRSVDTGMVHVFHTTHCGEITTIGAQQADVARIKMCEGSRNLLVASQRRMAKLIFEKKSLMLDLNI